MRKKTFNKIYKKLWPKVPGEGKLTYGNQLFKTEIILKHRNNINIFITRAPLTVLLFDIKDWEDR